MLASEAATASLRSRMTRCCCSTFAPADHYNESKYLISPIFMLSKVAEANFPSRFGHFRIFGFEGHYGADIEECVVLVMGDLLAPEPPLVRIHSQCLTGDVFHSLRCDCRSQL